MDSNTPTQVSATPSLSSSPMPLQLSGFLTGDTIQVQGETGNLQFSVRLDINKKLFLEKPAPLDSLDTIAYSPKNPNTEHSSFSSPSFSSSYATPIASRELNDRNIENVGESGARTRLRSGAISLVAYFPRIPLRKFGSSTCKRAKSLKKNSRGKTGVWERLLRRRSCPVRPCTSYAFFVMETWGVVKSSSSSSSSSFGETSRRIGQMWCKLPSNEKKLYEEMALKDKARYKWQAELFLNNEQGSLEESKNTTL